MLDLKQGDKIVCTRAYHPFVKGDVYELSNVAGNYWMCEHDNWQFIGFMTDESIRIAVGDVVNLFDMYAPEEDLNLKYSRSELIELMLEDGCSYVMCELTNGMKGFDAGEGLYDVGVVNWVESRPSISGWLFETVDGDFYDQARPINLDGSEMNYQDYLKTKNSQV